MRMQRTIDKEEILTYPEKSKTMIRKLEKYLKYKRHISVILLIFGLFLLCSCFGKWNLSITYYCYSNGSMKSLIKMSPNDETAREKIDEVKHMLQNQAKDSRIQEKGIGKSRYIIVTRTIPHSPKSYLQKRGNRWVFNCKTGRISENDKITHFTVRMPGIVTKTNATIHYLNYAVWQGNNIPDTFEVESLTTPFSLPIFTGLSLIFLILIISIYLFIKERRKDNKIAKDNVVE
jgi:hypothetical protein